MHFRPSGREESYHRVESTADDTAKESWHRTDCSFFFGGAMLRKLLHHYNPHDHQPNIKNYDETNGHESPKSKSGRGHDC